MTEQAGAPIAIISGGGALPALVAGAAAESGRWPVVFAIAGEAEPASLRPHAVHVVRWGEIGRFLRLLKSEECREAVLIGSIRRRPDFSAIRPDFGALKLLPRILQLMRGGDDSLLRGVAAILAEHGVGLVSPLDIAPQLALSEGLLAGETGPEARVDIEAAAAAARGVGQRDVGQAAVAVGGRVVAVEDADGTDALLARVTALRRSGTLGKGGVLVKCMKPYQDNRLDLPTIGPATAEAAHAAGLSGVAAEAGRALLAGRDETVAAFRREGLFLLGLSPPDPKRR